MQECRNAEWGSAFMHHTDKLGFVEIIEIRQGRFTKRPDRMRSGEGRIVMRPYAHADKFGFVGVMS